MVLVSYDREFIWLEFLVITYVKFDVVSSEESFKFKVFIKIMTTDWGRILEKLTFLGSTKAYLITFTSQ